MNPMANRYPRITGSFKISRDHSKINEAFEMIEDDTDNLQAGVNKADTDIINHKSSTQAHNAAAITYDGDVVGAETAKQAIDNVQTQLNAAILSGDSSVAAAQAAVDANGHDYKNLKLRIDTEHTAVVSQLADTSKEIFYESLVNSKSQKAMITILDDDTRSQLYSVIYPILREMNVPMTAAAITGRIQDVNGNTITKSQYNEMLSSGLVEFISHTENHINLTTLPLTEVENELKNSREWLIRNGGNPDYFVYPFNGQDSEIRKLTRKYYKGAFSTNATLNKPPLRTYVIGRVDFESTLEQQKAWINQAVQEGAWVIFNTHSHYPTFTAQGFRDMINYAKSVDIEFVTVGEGMSHFGNLLDVGDSDYDFENYATIDATGKMHGRLSTYKYVDRGSIISTTPITNFERMCTTICHYTSSAAASAGFPTAGVLKTNRVLSDDFSYQILEAYHSKTTYKRNWNNAIASWGDFEVTNDNFYLFSDTNEITATTTPSQMPLKLRNRSFSTKITSANSTGFPGAGLLITDVSNGDGFGFQLFHLYNTNLVYKRIWTGSWREWVLINGTSVLLSTDQKTINSPATDYETNKLSIMRITVGTLPGGATQGVLKTDARGGHSLNIRQTFEVTQSHDVYSRYWIHTSSVWSGWKKPQLVDV